MMFFELGFIDTGTVVETVAKSRRTELDEIEVTGEVFGQNNQVFPRLWLFRSGLEYWLLRRE